MYIPFTCLFSIQYRWQMLVLVVLNVIRYRYREQCVPDVCVDVFRAFHIVRRVIRMHRVRTVVHVQLNVWSSVGHFRSLK